MKLSYNKCLSHWSAAPQSCIDRPAVLRFDGSPLVFPPCSLTCNRCPWRSSNTSCSTPSETISPWRTSRTSSSPRRRAWRRTQETARWNFREVNKLKGLFYFNWRIRKQFGLIQAFLDAENFAKHHWGDAYSSDSSHSALNETNEKISFHTSQDWQSTAVNDQLSENFLHGFYS